MNPADATPIPIDRPTDQAGWIHARVRWLGSTAPMLHCLLLLCQKIEILSSSPLLYQRQTTTTRRRLRRLHLMMMSLRRLLSIDEKESPSSSQPPPPFLSLYITTLRVRVSRGAEAKDFFFKNNIHTNESTKSTMRCDAPSIAVVVGAKKKISTDPQTNNK